MKSMRLIAIASLALLGPARADLTIVQAVNGTGGVQRITMKVKGDKARVEVSPQVTTIIDAKTGAITNLLNDKKIVMTIPGDKAKAMAEMAKSFVKQESARASHAQANGQEGNHQRLRNRGIRQRFAEVSRQLLGRDHLSRLRQHPATNVASCKKALLPPSPRACRIIAPSRGCRCEPR